MNIFLKKQYTWAITCLIAWAALVSSCQDFLYVEPTNQLTVNSFTDVKRLLGGSLRNYKEGYTALGGVPNVLTFNTDYLITYFYSDDCNTDKYLSNWMGQNNKGDFRQSLTWQHPTVHETIWKTYYQAIGFYNLVLHELKKHPSTSQQENERVEADARVMRAYCFFKLLQLFAPYHDNNLGLPLNTNPDRVGDYDARRQTQTQNYQFIISELQQVLALKAEPEPEYNLFYNKTFIKGLLAQVYWYKGGSAAKQNTDYPNAVKFAQQVLDNGITYTDLKMVPTKNDNFGVYTNKPFAVMMFVCNETFFQDIVGDDFYGAPQYPSDDLYKLYTDNDKRKTLFFTPDKGIKRFATDFIYNFTRYILCSGAEMKLIIAECEARQGHNEQAKQHLLQFAQARYNNYQLPNDSQLLQSILDERRKEFCFEPNTRWLDMRRLGIIVQRKVDKKKKDDKNYQLEANDFRYTMPIPKKAELKNNNIPQNPGWGNF